MPGVVLGEVVSATNPLLPFFYQSTGVMTAPFSVEWKIYALEGTEIIASGEVDLDDDKVVDGYYVAAFDTTDSELVLNPGTHEIVWSYQEVEDGPTKTASYLFELLEAGPFRTGAAYVGYAPATAEGAICAWSVKQRQQAINRVSREIERLTGRFFFPRYVSNRHSVTHESRTLWFDAPVIGLSSIILEGGHPLIGVYVTTPYDLAGQRVYNRHLTGLTSPDDRDNPRVQFVSMECDSELDSGAVFPVGNQHLLVSGVFGYTDPDGSPFGCTPCRAGAYQPAIYCRRPADFGKGGQRAFWRRSHWSRF